MDLLRGYWSLELTFPDEKSASPRNLGTIKISHVIDRPSILSKPLVNDFLFRYTLRYVTSTRCPSTKFQNLSPPRVYLGSNANYNISRMTYKLRSSRSVFFKNHFSFSRNRRKLPIFSIFFTKNLSPPRLYFGIHSNLSKH